MIVADVLVVEGLGDDTDELVSDVVGEEVAEVHDGSVVLTAEPGLLFALAFTSDVTLVSTRNFCFARFSAALGIAQTSLSLHSLARKFFARQFKSKLSLFSLIENVDVLDIFLIKP